MSKQLLSTNFELFFFSTGGEYAPVPTHRLPCFCPQGDGLASDGKNCAPCQKGEFGSGGEVINNWNMWTENGTKPPEKSDMVNYCEFTRPFNSKYVCNPWKASGNYHKIMISIL